MAHNQEDISASACQTTMSVMNVLSILKLLIVLHSASSFSFFHHNNHQLKQKHTSRARTLSMALFDFASSNGSAAKIPTSTKDRDNQAISGIKAAIKNYREIPLIECEFPPLGALNKLGDGSLRSAIEAEEVRKIRNKI